MKILVKILCFTLAAYALITATLVIRQRSFIYHPVPSGPRTPAEFNVPFEEIKIPTADGLNLSGWWIHHSDPDPARPVLLYFHGNAATLSSLAHVSSIFYTFGWDALLFDYRSYGKSDPAAHGLSQDALAIDSKAAYDWLLTKVPAQRIVIWGHSLGSAIAAQLAARVDPAGLVLEGAFPSIYEMARIRFPAAPIFPFMIWDKFDTAAALRPHRYPILMMHAENDSIIPLALGKKLFDETAPPKEWMLVEHVDHNDFPSVYPAYEARLRASIGSWVRSSTADSSDQPQ